MEIGALIGRAIMAVRHDRNEPGRAHDALTAAAPPDNDATVDGLLMMSVRSDECRAFVTARERWDSEGGALVRQV